MAKRERVEKMNDGMNSVTVRLYDREWKTSHGYAMRCVGKVRVVECVHVLESDLQLSLELFRLTEGNTRTRVIVYGLQHAVRNGFLFVIHRALSISRLNIEAKTVSR